MTLSLSTLKYTRRLTLVSLCALALTLSGCGTEAQQATPTPIVMQAPADGSETPQPIPSGNEPTLEPYKFTDGSGAPFPVPSTEANPIRIVPREEAWGAGMDIKVIPALIDPEHMFLLRGVTEDGGTIVGLMVPRVQSDAGSTKLAVMDVSSRQLTEIAPLQLPNPGYYPFWHEVALDGEWVAWWDGSAISLYNVTTRASSQIETSTNGLESFHEIPMMVRVSIDRGVAVWAEGSGRETEGGRVDSVVKSIELSTGQISTLGEHGVYPVISWPLAAWIEPDLTTRTEGISRSKIVTMDLQTGAKRDLGTYHWVQGIGLHNDAIVLSFSGGLFNVLQDLTQTRRQIIMPEGYNSSHLYGSSLNERLATLSTGGAPRVWDRKLNHLVDLGGYGSSVAGRLINGNTLAWQVVPKGERVDPFKLPDNLTIYLLDTSQLPK